MKNNDAAFLLELKKKMEEAQVEVTRLDGRLEEVDARLYSETGCKSMNEVEKKRKELLETRKKVMVVLEAGVEKLKTHDWGE